MDCCKEEIHRLDSNMLKTTVSSRPNFQKSFATDFDYLNPVLLIKNFVLGKSYYEEL